MAEQGFRDADGGVIVLDMIACIQENSKRLSEIDGAIGDGDHGINMAKGFSLCGEKLAASPDGFTGSLRLLGEVLFTQIGGAMGPLYGTLFDEMAAAGKDEALITAAVFGRMLERAAAAVMEMGGAHVGDKTMVDTLSPAADAFKRGLSAGSPFGGCLQAMVRAAEAGKESTRGLVAKIGRASRLGERSRGVMDPGAASCALILGSMARTIKGLL
jgi:phosphoenolpyruvate---glycerone phosphotransferase subunit DhaL